MSGDFDARAGDRLEIADVIQRYAWFADVGDPVSQADLFADEGRLRFRQGDWVVGRGEIASFLSSHLAALEATCHCVATPSVTFAGPDAATSRSALSAWHRRADGRIYTLHGWYEDAWTCRAGPWQIISRQLVVAGADGRSEDGFLRPGRAAIVPVHLKRT